MSDHCGTATEEGNPVCLPGTCSCSSESKNIQPSIDIKNAENRSIVPSQTGEGHVEENS
jgi:hypothetical protein